MESTRITLRVQRRLAAQMDVRARMYGRSINEEYTRALQAWCEGIDWIELSLPNADLHDWTIDEEILRAQISPIVIERSEDRMLLSGRTITLRRTWFRSNGGFAEARRRLADSDVPEIPTSGPLPEAAADARPIAVYGWLSSPDPEPP